MLIALQIFVAAAQFGEGARTFRLEKDSEEEAGAVTVLMDEFFVGVYESMTKPASTPFQYFIHVLLPRSSLAFSFRAGLG